MKRGADKQLSKDDNPDDEVEEVQSGFQMAKESELARREIRGLPKRRSPAVAPAIPPPATTTTTTTTTQPATSQRFGGFSGLGATIGGTTPFTFAPSPLAGTPQKPADAPAVSDSASSATKKFASYLGPSSTAGAKPAVSSSEPKPDASGDTDELALKYYTSIRGLNSSFLSAVSKAFESDPFVDIVDLLEQYKKHRVSVQQNYDGKSSPAKIQSVPSPPSKPSVPAAPSSFAKLTMPMSPPSFAGSVSPNIVLPTSFSPATSASSDPKPASVASFSHFSSFTGASSSFKSAASQSSKEAESTPSSNSPFSLGGFPPSSTSGTFAFGGGNSSGSTSLPGTNTLLFGNPPKTSTLFGSDKPAQEEKDKETASSPPPPAPFSFTPASGGMKLFRDPTTGPLGSSSVFGASTTTKSAEEKDNKDNKEKDTASAAPPSNIFGGSFAASPKSSQFTFGAAASAATPAQFGFGVSPGGSEGSSPPPPKAGSVGFSFGSPSRTSSQATTTTAATGSVFGFPSMTSTSTPGAGAGGMTESTPAPGTAVSTHLDVPSSSASRGDTPATEGSLEEDGLARTQSPGLHGGEGEGEEDEETTFAVRARVFKFTTDGEGARTWSDMGLGMLRLKKHKETNARRFILRSSTTGKIIINFRIYPGLQPMRRDKVVSFTGHITSPGKDTQSVQYRLRVGSEASATELAEAIEREVRLVQTSSSPST